MAVNGQWTANGVTTPGLPIIAGPDGALWLIGGYTGFGPGSAGSIDRLRGGVLTTFTNPDISFNLGSDFGPSAITAGPDGAVWFVDPDRNLIGRITTASSVTTLPTQGPRGSIVTLSGHGFASGEGVSVAYQTGLASPSTVQLCNPRTAADGTWTCTATVPGDATAGHHGTHTITAIGKRSGRRVATMYLLTR
jgi:hypothetical protein